MPQTFTIANDDSFCQITFVSVDNLHRLTKELVADLTSSIHNLLTYVAGIPLLITGLHNFSVGADLNEIAALTGLEAYEFSGLGQSLMNLIESYPAPVIAAIEGHCMGGGLDLALACHRRISAPNAVFGHRGAALGLITGWGGTQRLPRLIGKGKALELLVAAEKVNAADALRIGLVDAVSSDPVAAAKSYLQRWVSVNNSSKRTTNDIPKDKYHRL